MGVDLVFYDFLLKECRQRNVGKAYFINVTLHLIFKITNFFRVLKNSSQHLLELLLRAYPLKRK